MADHATNPTRPCERCGTMIPPERIEILPDTRLCVACSQAVGGEFQISFVAENLAKSGTMKKNYGAISMKKTRKPVRRAQG
ncbi:TraR/DksA C4-type zinc finger protein [Humisphaera borealis]|uniref:TraR/DksA C4-type zinc finger protein n=1 Tax=Humisphaera borealis TaxID=2807512 RepID=A0A7M2X0K7_9BACT|nr:TraR/DksA C4-type zinc finger protein [Humisphaera borealis]QOV91213.1 TraR/DksA C4-type zinc finger protein [Humisphaera borealis]